LQALVGIHTVLRLAVCSFPAMCIPLHPVDFSNFLVLLTTYPSFTGFVHGLDKIPGPTNQNMPGFSGRSSISVTDRPILVLQSLPFHQGYSTSCQT
jgi:hypothetical protein